MSPKGFDNSHRLIRHEPLNAEVRPEALRTPLTSNRHFFIRSNFSCPSSLIRDPAVRIEGAVGHPRGWSLRELRERPQRTVTVTTDCAGNGRTGLHPTPLGEPWRHGAVSTAEWTGVPLAELLHEAGLDVGVLEILACGRDRGVRDGDREIDFARSLPVGKAQDPDTLVALEMNGEPIPKEHGAPVRLIVPGWYGMASVKWLFRIVALTDPFTGYFQFDRYRYEFEDGTAEPVTTIRPRSMVTHPGNDSRLPYEEVQIRGWAWSGSGPVTRVEVAVGGGDDWEEAHLGESASPYSWRPWTFDWKPTERGLFVLRSRATDASGAVQPDRARWNRHGYGNNAIRPVFVRISGRLP